MRLTAMPLTRNKNYTRYMTVFFNACGNCKIILETVIQNKQYTKEIRFFVTSRAWNKKSLSSQKKSKSKPSYSALFCSKFTVYIVR